MKIGGTDGLFSYKINSKVTQILILFFYHNYPSELGRTLSQSPTVEMWKNSKVLKYVFKDLNGENFLMSFTAL